MLTRDTTLRMNALTLAGLLIRGFGLALLRVARASLPLCIG